MFNRSIQMSVVKTPKNSQNTTVEEHKPFMTKDEAHEIAKDMVKRTAVAIVAVMTAAAVLHTASEVTINNTDPKRKK